MSEPAPLPSDWHNHEGLVAIFRAALQGFCANPEFFGAIYQGSPRAAVDFAKDVLRAALDQGAEPNPPNPRDDEGAGTTSTSMEDQR